MSTVQSQIEKQFNVDVKQHAGELLISLNSARKERRLCDFVIKVGSKEIHAHKIILSETSVYFRGMFSHAMKEKASGVVEMKGVDPECMVICIEYIYTGKASIFGSKIQQLLQAADMLQLPGLCKAIGLFLQANLDPDSFFPTLKVAKTFNLQGLKEHCDKYAMEKFTSIAVKEDFKELENEYVSFLVGSKENKASEAVKCKALILWASSDHENRSKTFEESFQMLQLEEIPASYRLYLSQQESLVAESAKCLRSLIKSNQAALGTTIMKDLTLEENRSANGEQSNAIAVFESNSKSIQAFHPEDNTWTRVHDVTDEIIKKDFTAVTSHETVYILATDKTNYKLNYTDPNATWIQLPDRQATDRVLAVILHGELYAVHDYSTSSLAIEKLDSSTTTWSKVADKHVACCDPAIVATGDYLYSFGGYNGSHMNNAGRFDPIARTWHRLPVMLTARSGAAAVELEEKIYVIGGLDGRNYLYTVECFNIQSETWATVTPTNCHYYRFNACVIDCKIYAVGGYNSQRSIEEFNETSNSWKTVDKMSGKVIKDLATFSLCE